MKKKKLLHITSSLKMGGAEVLLCDIIEEIGTTEFEHQVIYFHDGPRAKRLKALGVTLHHVRGLFCLYDPVFFVRLFRLMKKLKPDCIHSLLWAANVASRVFAKFLSIPHISAYHIHIDQDGKLRKFIDKLTIGFSDRLVAVSPEVAESFLPAVSACKRDRVSVIENGIDAESIRRKGKEQAVCRAELGLSNEHFVIGTVGRFAPRKNFPLLIESFAKVHKEHPKASLVLLGTGPDEQLLRLCAQDFGVADNVLFVVGKSAYGYFPIFDCFVQSSDKEGLSIALLEAMSFGVPSVVIETGPAHPVIKNRKNGLVVTQSDSDLLADAIQSVLEDAQFSRFLGQNGLADVEARFSVAGMVEAYRRLFLELSGCD